MTFKDFLDYCADHQLLVIAAALFGGIVVFAVLDLVKAVVLKALDGPRIVPPPPESYRPPPPPDSYPRPPESWR